MIYAQELVNISNSNFFKFGEKNLVNQTGIPKVMKKH